MGSLRSRPGGRRGRRQRKKPAGRRRVVSVRATGHFTTLAAGAVSSPEFERRLPPQQFSMQNEDTEHLMLPWARCKTGMTEMYVPFCASENLRWPIPAQEIFPPRNDRDVRSEL